MRERKGKVFAVWLFCLVVAALPAFWMPAGSSARDLDGGCFRGRPGFGMMMHGLNRLDLSTEQKHDIALILKEKRNEARTMVDQMVEARKKLFTTIGSTDYNESAIRQAAQEVARRHEELVVLRAQAGQQIKEVLTSDQKAKMEAAIEHFGQRMQEHIDGHFDHLDQWIEENSR